MEFTTIEAKNREIGKRASRKVRNEGNVPCILYGHHIEPINFQIEAAGLSRLIRSQETSLVTIELEDKSWQCILKDVDYHPVSDEPIHADFQVLKEGEKIGLTVPFRFLGTPVGQTDGGSTQHVLSEVEITCLPKDIPPYIEVDISHLGIGDAVHLSEVSVEGVEFNAPPSQTVAMVHAPRILALPEEEEVEELLGLEGEEGEGEEEAGGEAEEEAEE